MLAVKSKCILSINTPLYKRKYRRLLHSQEAYALRHGYQYNSVSLSQDNAGQSKWHKIECLIGCLNIYDAVLLLDNDCLVRKDAPDICNEVVEGKMIYMARGPSGRFNSGVIFTLSADESKRFFQEVLASRYKIIQIESFVSSEGENGHIIELSKDPAFTGIIQELDYKWNNNTFPYAPDYIRHFTAALKKEQFGTQKLLRELLMMSKKILGW